MQIERFQEIVAQLEKKSASSPTLYKAKVLALVTLGFALVGVFVISALLGLAALAGLVVMLAFLGPKGIALIVKFGYVLLLAAIPLWYLIVGSVRALLVRFPAPQGREITPSEAPELFALLDTLRASQKGPRIHKVLLVDQLNAAVVQHARLGMFGFTRNYLLLGLPLFVSISQKEGVSVLAHEYGHLSGAHGRFASFIYRFRSTMGAVEEHVEEFKGLVGSLVRPIIRWYAPYFNAYTYVMARAHEYDADQEAAQLSGAKAAAHALKRTNVINPAYHQFMEKNYSRVETQANPPSDVLTRWSVEAPHAIQSSDAKSWLLKALDEEPDVTDTHPTLRKRLMALPDFGESLEQLPPVLGEPSAAHAWFGTNLPVYCKELQTEWAEGIAKSWTERHDTLKQKRARLNELRSHNSLSEDEELACLNLTWELEPKTDLRTAVAAFNAKYPNNAVGLWIEGNVLLDHGQREGLSLLDRVMDLDPDAVSSACQRAFYYLMGQNEVEAADKYLQRYRDHAAFEARTQEELNNVSTAHELVEHDLTEDMMVYVRSLLNQANTRYVSQLYLARRILPSNPSVQTYLIGYKLTLLGHLLRRSDSVLQSLSKLEWPMQAYIVFLAGHFAGFKKKFWGLKKSRLI